MADAPKKGNLVPDYRNYLQRSLLLKEDVSKPFLIILKKHLTDTKSSMDAIETWLDEPSKDLEFLNQCFDVDVSPPELEGCNGFCSKACCSSGCLCIGCFLSKCQCKDRFKANHYSPETVNLLVSTTDIGDMNLRLKVSSRVDQAKLKRLLSLVNYVSDDIPEEEPLNCTTDTDSLADEISASATSTCS